MSSEVSLSADVVLSQTCLETLLLSLAHGAAEDSQDSTGSGSEAARGNGAGDMGFRVMQSPGTNLSPPASGWETVEN